MKRLLAAVALMTLALTPAASGGYTSAPSPVTSSRLVDGGNIRITATIGTSVEVGRPLEITYRVENISKVARKVRLAFNLWYVVRSPDGTTYDTRVAFRSMSVPYVPPKKLRPGQSVTLSGPVARVRWAGPLQITPGWSQTALPSLRAAVTTPGPRPSAAIALADVVSSTGHLLDRCTPTKLRVAVTGIVVAPKHSAPPLHVACSVSLYRENGFYQAQVLVVSPPRLPAHMQRTYERFTYLNKPGRNATAVGWLFVVTRRGAVSVDSTTVDSTKTARRMAPDWQWTTSGWTGREGGARCGHTGGGGGGYSGPFIEFVSACR